MRPALLGGVVAVTVLVSMASAQPIALTGGRTARVNDREGTSNDKASLRFVRDPALVALQDPRCPTSSTIELTANGQDTGVISLPCANWSVAASGFRYVDRDGVDGPVRRITYKSGGLNVLIKGAGFAPLNGPVSELEVRYTIGSTRYCGRFEVFSRNTPERIAAKAPTTPCEPLCGDGFVDPGEQCDDGNATSGDCCSATCQAESGSCDDDDLCTLGDTCSGGNCVSTPVQPWINEIDYDDFAGVLEDRDEFIEIAAPAGTDLSGYRILSVEGNLNGNTMTNGAPCLTDFDLIVTTGNPYFIGTLPLGTVVPESTGTGIGYLTVCFANTSTNRQSNGECDIVLPAPSLTSNLKNGFLLNTNAVDCPDGVALVDPFDTLVDAVSYEGRVPNLGLYGDLFQTPSYSIGSDQGWVAGVSLERGGNAIGRASSSSDWSASGGCTVAAPTEDPQQTTLAANIGAGDGTIPLTSMQPFPPWYPALPLTGTVKIGNELLAYSGQSGNNLNGAVRGISGTAAAPHLAGAAVALFTGCERNSASPGATNFGQQLSCVPGACGNGVINLAAGEQCDPAATPNGCTAQQECVSVGEPAQCTCADLCPNGQIDAGEACDPLAASSCAGASPCNSDCTCPPSPTCVSVSYVTALSGLDLCTAVVGPCPPPISVGLATPATLTTYELCFRPTDSGGRIAITVDPSTYFNDAGFTPAGGTVPIALTQRFCQEDTATGTLFTTADASSFPVKRCLVGNPATLLRSCAANGDCDGPTPLTGNGICGTRDVDYTSDTTPSGTIFSIGDGTPDAAGSVLLSHSVMVQAFLVGDVRCTGDGVNPTCVTCDGVTPVPAGRIGVQQSAMGGVLLLPLDILWTTGSAENTVIAAGNYIHGRQVMGAGAPGDIVAGGEYELAAANASLNIPGILGLSTQVQFLTKELRAPAP